MTDQLRQAAQQALEALIDAANVLSAPMFADAVDALRTALEQQAEPPPEWPLIKNILAVFGLDAIAFVAEFKAAQRQWVGLEIEEVQDSYNSDYQAQTRAVEKLLKERNT
jgi:hypothetical protein